MAKYLLDTCVCISMFRNEGNVRDTLRNVGVENCYISEITVAELYFGLAKSTDKKRYSVKRTSAAPILTWNCFPT